MKADTARPKARLRPGITREALEQRIKGTLPELIGMEFLSIEEGKITARMAVRGDLMAPNGFLHAASIIGLADTACGLGTKVHLPEGTDNFTTVELKTNFIGAVREGALVCEASLVHGGRTVQVWDALVTEEGTGKPVALFRCTQMLLTSRQP